MGTRSLTHFREDGKIIATMYGQWDGGPNNYGTTLATFLESKQICNGYRDPGSVVEVNGMGDLAAQVIAHLKTRPSYGGLDENKQPRYSPEGVPTVGNWYVMAPDTVDVGEVYTYTVELTREPEAKPGEPMREPGDIRIIVHEHGRTTPIFRGSPKAFLAKMAKAAVQELLKGK